ncbi:MAG: hypothetical protein JW739_06225 [Opitutales bacterium]|nr:hypothetical protein [Opitutales bacterium]
MSADPIVQSPMNLQSYNRYSYCMNNPLTYVDPSGYSKENPRDNYYLNKARDLKDTGHPFKSMANSVPGIAIGIYDSAFKISNELQNGGRKTRSEGFDMMIQHPSDPFQVTFGATSYLVGGGFEFVGGFSEATIETPENIVNLAAPRLKATGWLGEQMQQEGELEIETFNKLCEITSKTLEDHKGELAKLLIDNADSILYSAVSGDDLDINVAKSLETSNFAIELNARIETELGISPFSISGELTSSLLRNRIFSDVVRVPELGKSLSGISLSTINIAGRLQGEINRVIIPEEQKNEDYH